MSRAPIWMGKLRRIDTHTLWVQQAVRSKNIDLRKVDGAVNPADIFTKHSLTRERLIALTRLFDVEFQGGGPRAQHKHGLPKDRA